jgi:transcriptional regulator with XRE-family HTH domain
MKAISDKIAIARKQKNLTQSDLAKKVCITPQMVSKWERGESLPDVEMLGKLAEILGVAVPYFYGGSEADAISGEDRYDETKKAKSRAKLNDHKWKGNDFSNSALTDLDFGFARLADCNFSGCDISGKKLSYTEFIKCKLNNTIFKKSKMFRTDINDSNLDNADFSCVELKDADFKNCSFDGVIFTNATIKDTVFKKCVLKNCNFVNAIFENCEFDESTFENCSADKITYNFLLTCKANIKGIKVNEQ